MNALSSQVSGSHYKNMNMQPVELFALTRCTAFQANIWKYIARYKYKNGAEDIKKAIHYAQLAIELKCNGNLNTTQLAPISDFCYFNNLSPAVSSIIMQAGQDNYKAVIKKCQALLKVEYNIG